MNNLPKTVEECENVFKMSFIGLHGDDISTLERFMGCREAWLKVLNCEEKDCWCPLELQFDHFTAIITFPSKEIVELFIETFYK
ncbi:MAG: hypothetical protein IKU29_06400 [Parabacteroides sp.]|nr:hypothetical protein [Parabacteroides sp.]